MYLILLGEAAYMTGERVVFLPQTLHPGGDIMMTMPDAASMLYPQQDTQQRPAMHALVCLRTENKCSGEDFSGETGKHW